jgi:hypothetical protein
MSVATADDAADFVQPVNFVMFLVVMPFSIATRINDFFGILAHGLYLICGYLLR